MNRHSIIFEHKGYLKQEKLQKLVIQGFLLLWFRRNNKWTDMVFRVVFNKLVFVQVVTYIQVLIPVVKVPGNLLLPAHKSRSWRCNHR